MNFVDFRCGKCDKLLGKINGNAEIKCPRCNSLNVLHNNKVSVVPNAKTGVKENPGHPAQCRQAIG